MKIFVYTHRIDLDGITSGAIMKRYAQKSGLESKIDFINYEPRPEAIAVFNSISNLPADSHIVIVDFGYTKSLETEEEAALRKFSSRGGKITWLDHHKWDSSFMNKINQFATLKVSGSTEACGAELAFSEFMKEDKVSEALAKLGRDADIDAWKTDPPKPKYALTVPLGNIITYYNYIGRKDLEKRRELLASLVDKLASAPLEEILNQDFQKPLNDKGLEAVWEEYKALEKAKLEECINGAETFERAGYKCAVGFADEILASSLAAYSLLNAYDCQLSIVFYENGRLGIRRRNNRTDIKCNEIAALFNGGGHEFAVGGTLNTHMVNKADIANAKRKIIDTLLKS